MPNLIDANGNLSTYNDTDIPRESGGTRIQGGTVDLAGEFIIDQDYIASHIRIGQGDKLTAKGVLIKLDVGIGWGATTGGLCTSKNGQIELNNCILKTMGSGPPVGLFQAVSDQTDVRMIFRNCQMLHYADNEFKDILETGADGGQPMIGPNALIQNLRLRGMSVCWFNGDLDPDSFGIDMVSAGNNHIGLAVAGAGHVTFRRASSDWFGLQNLPAEITAIDCKMTSGVVWNQPLNGTRPFRLGKTIECSVIAENPINYDILNNGGLVSRQTGLPGAIGKTEVVYLELTAPADNREGRVNVGDIFGHGWIVENQLPLILRQRTYLYNPQEREIQSADITLDTDAALEAIGLSGVAILDANISATEAEAAVLTNVEITPDGAGAAIATTAPVEVQNIYDTWKLWWCAEDQVLIDDRLSVSDGLLNIEKNSLTLGGALSPSEKMAGITAGDTPIRLGGFRHDGLTLGAGGYHQFNNLSENIEIRTASGAVNILSFAQEAGDILWDQNAAGVEIEGTGQVGICTITAAGDARIITIITSEPATRFRQINLQGADTTDGEIIVEAPAASVEIQNANESTRVVIYEAATPGNVLFTSMLAAGNTTIPKTDFNPALLTAYKAEFYKAGYQEYEATINASRAEPQIIDLSNQLVSYGYTDDPNIKIGRITNDAGVDLVIDPSGQININLHNHQIQLLEDVDFNHAMSVLFREWPNHPDLYESATGHIPADLDDVRGISITEEFAITGIQFAKNHGWAEFDAGGNYAKVDLMIQTEGNAPGHPVKYRLTQDGTTTAWAELHDGEQDTIIVIDHSAAEIEAGTMWKDPLYNFLEKTIRVRSGGGSFIRGYTNAERSYAAIRDADISTRLPADQTKYRYIKTQITHEDFLGTSHNFQKVLEIETGNTDAQTILNQMAAALAESDDYLPSETTRTTGKPWNYEADVINMDEGFFVRNRDGANIAGKQTALIKMSSAAGPVEFSPTRTIRLNCPELTGLQEINFAIFRTDEQEADGRHRILQDVVGDEVVGKINGGESLILPIPTDIDVPLAIGFAGTATPSESGYAAQLLEGAGYLLVENGIEITLPVASEQITHFVDNTITSNDVNQGVLAYLDWVDNVRIDPDEKRIILPTDGSAKVFAVGGIYRGWKNWVKNPRNLGYGIAVIGAHSSEIVVGNSSHLTRHLIKIGAGWIIDTGQPGETLQDANGNIIISPAAAHAGIEIRGAGLDRQSSDADGRGGATTELPLTGGEAVTTTIIATAASDFEKYARAKLHEIKKSSEGLPAWSD